MEKTVTPAGQHIKNMKILLKLKKSLSSYMSPPLIVIPNFRKNQIKQFDSVSLYYQSHFNVSTFFKVNHLNILYICIYVYIRGRK